MRRVAIFGVGLIGGSFALALRRAGFDGEILGVSSRKTVETAVARSVIDRGTTAEEAIQIADLIYLAQPILTIIDTLAAIGPKLHAHTLVTDAGSTKKQIVEQAYRKIPRALFIGGHPMAGKESSGVEHAEANLFDGRPYVLTPRNPADTETAQFQALQEWIVRIGARPVVLDPSEHDRLVAFTSHVPQLLSTALAAVIADVDKAGVVAGPAVRELTRLGLSSFTIWRDIFRTNEFIPEALSSVVQELAQIGKILHSDALQQEFDRAADGARIVREQTAQDFR